jgi:hypothetical protein
MPLEKILGGPREGALLRHSLDNDWLKARDPSHATDWFRNTVKRNSKYSAAFERCRARRGPLECRQLFRPKHK